MMVAINPTWRDVRRAIEIAQQDGLRVVGTTTINGVQVFAIPSRSHPGTVHMPYVDPEQQRVVCDCEGYQYRGVCAHAMVATRAIIAQAQTVVDALRGQGLPALAPAEQEREAS